MGLLIFLAYLSMGKAHAAEPRFCRNLIIPKAVAAVTTESPLRENAEVGGLPAKSVPGPAGAAEPK